MSRAKERPDDKAARQQIQAVAKRYGLAIAKRHRRALYGLLTTYADDDAHRKLNALRDGFWAGELPSAATSSPEGEKP